MSARADALSDTTDEPPAPGRAPPPTRHVSVEPYDNLPDAHDASNLGMWVFLSTEVMFFGVVFAAYVMMRVEHGAAFAEASRHTEVLLGTLNTAVLLTSSLAIALAGRLADTPARRARLVLLAITALLGVAFLAIKGVEYSHDFDKHLVPGIDFAFDGPDARGVALFFWLYFVGTGFHALHLTIGVVAVVVVAVRDWRRPGRGGNAIELTGLYWHLVDIVWIFLYPVLYLVGRA